MAWADNLAEMIRRAPAGAIRDDMISMAIYPPAVRMTTGHVFSMAQIQSGERGDYVLDQQGRRWMLDGSGEVA